MTTMDNPRAVGMGRRMRMARAAMGLTQAEAAAFAQVSRNTWARWERKPATIPYREWQRLDALVDEWWRGGPLRRGEELLIVTGKERR